MSQKSILSFFKQADKSLQDESNTFRNSSKSSNGKASISNKSPEKKSSEVNGHNQKEDASTNGSSKPVKPLKISGQNDNDSPIKQTRKRKIKQIIDSDEESTEIEKETSNILPEKETEKMDVDSDLEKKADKKKPKQEIVLSKEELKSKLSASMKKTNTPAKKRKKEKQTDDPPVSEKKVTLDSSTTNGKNNSDINLNHDSVQNDLTNGKDLDVKLNDASIDNSASTSSNLNDTNSRKIIPKRKTARKSMKGKGEPKEKTSPTIESSPDLLNSENDNSNKKSKSNKKKSSTPEKFSPVKETLPESTENGENSNKSPSASLKTKSKNKSSVIETEELNKDKKELNTPISKKPQAIHPFFARKDVQIKVKEEEDDTSTIKREENESEIETGAQNSIKEEAATDSEVSKSELKDKKNKSEKKNNSKKSITNESDNEKNLKDTSNEDSNKKKINASTTSSGVLYDPSKSKYHPINDACWKYKEKVPYLALAKTLELIENTSARLKIVEILSNFFRSVIVLTPEDLLQSVYLCLNRIAPEYEGIELGVGDMLLMKAVAQATGRTLDKIRTEVKEKGDLGLVAESSRGNQKVMFAPPKLTVASVFSKFKEIAKMSGNAVMGKKTDKIQVLFVACRDCEAKYIIRSLSGKLRIGLAEQSVLAALGRAIVMTPPGQSFPPEIIDKSSQMSSDSFKKLQDAKVLILKTTYCECPNYDLVIPVLLKVGIDGLPEHCQLSPGCPLKPMLAHPTAGIDEVLRRFDNNEFTCEFKYDGERAQIHRTESGEVRVFSRNQEDNTSKYPDVIARISKTLKESTKSFILDTEAVAWDREAKQILPFQILSTRKKKDAVESEIVVQVCVMAFDLLYLNGESLVKKTLKERRELLHASFVEVDNEFRFVTYKDGNSAETMQEFLDESVKGNCEGLMVKALEVDASYEIAKRSHNWLKLKKDYLEGVGDTLDLVVIGGYHGKGKRTGNYGGFLLACYDEENEEFQSICKLGTGFKEDELDAHTKFLKQHVIKSPKSYYRYDSSLEPDEWFEAVQTWEIKCADLSISPIHKAAAGIVDPEKGISLRFPRYLRIREDKKPEDATNSTQIAQMYQSQEQVQNMKGKARPEEDYY